MTSNRKIIRGWIVMLMPKIFIFYYPEENMFKTEDNKTIINIYPLVNPNQIFLFKNQKKTIEFVNEEYGLIIRLLYPVEKEE